MYFLYTLMSLLIKKHIQITDSAVWLTFFDRGRTGRNR
jgi:hypothetical protein